VAEKWFRIWQSYQDDVIEAHKTTTSRTRSRPRATSPGGLTTIEEKALGNLRRSAASAATSTPWSRRGARQGPGLYFMDTSSAAAECVTLMAAGGYVVHTFPTGQGNVIGNPIVPVIKITATRRPCAPCRSTWTSTCRACCAAR
jgi:(2R)-sulfolactate sulfo-lyase subunit beta